MYLIKPLRDFARDSVTGGHLPKQGVTRPTLTNSDYLSQRTGDVSIELVIENEATKGKK